MNKGTNGRKTHQAAQKRKSKQRPQKHLWGNNSLKHNTIRMRGEITISGKIHYNVCAVCFRKAALLACLIVIGFAAAKALGF